ncbi:hypothetical protein N656DRAFT_752651 [Canariomyces notabilis]|uniref:Zn(2)-C6 fungal-type domain-containing protein n=1 Tax=Canariomyces notabilis TaxID=2074819 RepID=A0AAN6YTI5_9PEZI|nr:hypothetical protein N656DRAFT_752651 [Canariomyces arenarius]
MTTASSSTSSKRSIRPHRKSRAGCTGCKRRKVKCDEEKPCSNCTRFGLPCDLVAEGASVEYSTRPFGQRDSTGRYASNVLQPAAPHHPTTTATSIPTPTSLCTEDADPPAAISLDNAELLLHFVNAVAATFAPRGSPANIFWTREAPQIGLSHTFVLHLILASSAFHLAYLAAKPESEHTTITRLHQTRTEYLSLAQRHLTAGLSGFTAALSEPGPENCGALYLGAVLTSYCTFAAGPASRDDLLICTTTDGGTPPSSSAPEPVTAMPFVYGVRLVHQSFTPDVLFAGPLAALRTTSSGTSGPSPVSTDSMGTPVYARDGFARLDWEGPLHGLRRFIAGADAGADEPEGGLQPGDRARLRTATTTAVCLQSLDDMMEIYAALYGRRTTGPDGASVFTYDGPSANQFVFGWLYRMDLEFVACVRRREPCALLVLAYYTLLLNGDAVQSGWYVEGWREHIINKVDELLVGREEREVLVWVKEQAAMFSG